jgi:hypothetical protein
MTFPQRILAWALDRVWTWVALRGAGVPVFRRLWLTLRGL